MDTSRIKKKKTQTAFLSQKTVRCKVFPDPLPIPILPIVKVHNLGLTFPSKPMSAKDGALGNKIDKNK